MIAHQHIQPSSQKVILIAKQPAQIPLHGLLIQEILVFFDVLIIPVLAHGLESPEYLVEAFLTESLLPYFNLLNDRVIHVVFALLDKLLGFSLVLHGSHLSCFGLVSIVLHDVV